MTRASRGRPDERGQGTAEYVGIVAFAALLVVALLAVTVQLSSEAKDVASTAYCKISSTVGGGGSCGGESGEPGDDPSEEPSEEPSPEPEEPDLPEGLDPDNEVTQALLATEDGRALLQWLHDNDIEVVLDPDETAYWYSDGTLTIGMDDGNGGQRTPGEGAVRIFHEANHAQYDVEDLNADVDEQDRDSFIHDSVYEDAVATAEQIRAARQLREAGYEVPRQPGEGAYEDAYDDAIADGKSPAEAFQAATDAVNEEYYNGGIVQSTDGKSYPDKWGEVWDDAH